MINIILKIFLITNILFCKDYLIITSDELSEAAYKISDIYSDNTKTYFLETEVVLTSEINFAINEFISSKIDNDENTYFLAWTTTPWTLPSNMALCAGPDLDYIKLQVSLILRIRLTIDLA